MCSIFRYIFQNNNHFISPRFLWRFCWVIPEHLVCLPMLRFNPQTGCSHAFGNSIELTNLWSVTQAVRFEILDDR
jgi:hypothetical protein